MKFDTYTTKQNKTHQGFESPFETNKDAAEALFEKLSTPDYSNEFAYSLCESYNHPKWGGEAMSEGRAFWMHKLAMPEVAPEPAHHVNVSRIVAMFASAGEQLKRPKIVLRVDSGAEIKFYIAGERSKHVGNVMIVSPTYGGAYYGRIDQIGNVFEAGDMNDEVRALVVAFASDPETVAASHGALTGCCCFCSRSLSTDESKAVGYGPVCAKRYKLSWGTKVRGTFTAANVIGEPVVA
jgi:hypothetical protein